MRTARWPWLTALGVTCGANGVLVGVFAPLWVAFTSATLVVAAIVVTIRLTLNDFTR